MECGKHRIQKDRRKQELKRSTQHRQLHVLTIVKRNIYLFLKGRRSLYSNLYVSYIPTYILSISSFSHEWLIGSILRMLQADRQKHCIDEMYLSLSLGNLKKSHAAENIVFSLFRVDRRKRRKILQGNDNLASQYFTLK